MRILKIKVCSRCKRKRPIYQIKKQLCASCRTLERFEREPKAYERLKKQIIERYRKNPEPKRKYNKRYYIKHAEHLKSYGRKYWREVASKR